MLAALPLLLLLLCCATVAAAAAAAAAFVAASHSKTGAVSGKASIAGMGEADWTATRAAN